MLRAGRPCNSKPRHASLEISLRVKRLLEVGSSKQRVAESAHTCWTSPRAATTHGHHEVLPGVYDAQVFVLAGGDKEAATVIPTDIVDKVSVQVIQCQEGLPSTHVPEDDHIVSP